MCGKRKSNNNNNKYENKNGLVSLLSTLMFLFP